MGEHAPTYWDPTSATVPRASEVSTARRILTTVGLIHAKTVEIVLTVSTHLNASVNHRIPEELAKLKWIRVPPTHVLMAPYAVLTGTTKTSPVPALSGLQVDIAMKT